MTLDRAYRLLNTYANQLSKLGDAKEAIKTKQKLFVEIYSKVKENFEYIKSNAMENEEVLNAAIDVLVCTTIDNPTFGKLLEKMPESSNIEYIEKLVAQNSVYNEIFETNEITEEQFVLNDVEDNIKKM